MIPRRRINLARGPKQKKRPRETTCLFSMATILSDPSACPPKSEGGGHIFSYTHYLAIVVSFVHDAAVISVCLCLDWSFYVENCWKKLIHSGKASTAVVLTKQKIP